MLLISISKAQQKLAENLKAQRLAKGLTQQGLSERADVSLPTLRKFEQKGLISLESFLKLTMVLDCLEEVLTATEPAPKQFGSIEEVLSDKDKKQPKRGWRK